MCESVSACVYLCEDSVSCMQVCWRWSAVICLCNQIGEKGCICSLLFIVGIFRKRFLQSNLCLIHCRKDCSMKICDFNLCGEWVACLTKRCCVDESVCLCHFFTVSLVPCSKSDTAECLSFQPESLSSLPPSSFSFPSLLSTGWGFPAQEQLVSITPLY